LRISYRCECLYQLLKQSLPVVGCHINHRLRRDFKTILVLIRAHALLHQESRRKDTTGRIIAEIRDYAAIRGLVVDLVSEGAEVTIKPEVRETVLAVQKLMNEGGQEVQQSVLAKELKVDKSAASRRVGAALQAGVLRNLEDRKGRPSRLVVGDPLPEEIELLPRPERLHGCAVAEGDKSGPAQKHNGCDADVANDNERCAYCRKGAASDDPLLLTAVAGETFLAHQECRKREYQSWRLAA
jgi:hypothetical protein